MAPSCFFLFPERVKQDDVEISDKGLADRLRPSSGTMKIKLSWPTIFLTKPQSFDSLPVFHIIGANEQQMTSLPRESLYA
jgi:hypothetical protein